VKALLIAIPKSGTNMMTQVIARDCVNIPYGSALYQNVPNERTVNQLKTFEKFGRTHVGYHPTYESLFIEHGISPIFLRRDPRDVITSHYHWMKAGNPDLPKVGDGVRTMEDADPVMYMITYYGQHFRRHLPWLFVPFIHQLKYEDILEKPIQAFQGILDFFGKELCGIIGLVDPEQMMRRIKPEQCVTYRKGIIGDWRNLFTQKHLDAFNREFPKEMMEMLGYEL